MSPCRDKNFKNFFSLVLEWQLMSTDLSACSSLSAWTACKGLHLTFSSENKETEFWNLC